MSPWRFQQMEPQPARGTLREEMWDSPDWIAEEKYDGDRRVAQFCGRIVRFTGRRKSVDGSGFVEKTANVPHLAGTVPGWKGPHGETWPKLWAPAAVPPVPPAALDGTVLDGEMIWGAPWQKSPSGEGMSKYVTSIMGSLPEEAIRKQRERGFLSYVVFDILWWKGEDVRRLPLHKRRPFMLEAMRAWKNPFAEAAESFSGDKRAFLKDVLAAGGEGVILKRLDHRYGDKTGWVKVKAEITEDVVVMGYKAARAVSKKVDGSESETKYAKAGLIGAVLFGQYREGKLVACGACSGMDDDVRAELTKHGKKYVGEVIEIKANGREGTGAFRHPRMIGFRPDKNAKDCVWERI